MNDEDFNRLISSKASLSDEEINAIVESAPLDDVCEDIMSNSYRSKGRGLSAKVNTRAVFVAGVAAVALFLAAGVFVFQSSREDTVQVADSSEVSSDGQSTPGSLVIDDEMCRNSGLVQVEGQEDLMVTGLLPNSWKGEGTVEGVVRTIDDNQVFVAEGYALPIAPLGPRPALCNAWVESLTVEELLAKEPITDVVEVRGMLYSDDAISEEVRLCSPSPDTLPPSCGRSSIAVEGLAMEQAGEIRSSGDIRWKEAVELRVEQRDNGNFAVLDVVRNDGSYKKIGEHSQATQSRRTDQSDSTEMLDQSDSADGNVPPLEEDLSDCAVRDADQIRQQLRDEIGELGEEGGGILLFNVGDPEIVGKIPSEVAINEYLEKDFGKSQPCMISVCEHVLLTAQQGAGNKAYILAGCSGSIEYNSEIAVEEAGKETPALKTGFFRLAIVLELDPENPEKIVGKQEPRDGSLLQPDIKEMFPASAVK